MAKIKLNAASGGGSVSIQGPSSTGNNRVFTLNDSADGIIQTTTLGPAFFARNNNSQSLSNGTTNKFNLIMKYLTQIVVMTPQPTIGLLQI